MVGIGAFGNVGLILILFPFPLKEKNYEAGSKQAGLAGSQRQNIHSPPLEGINCVYGYAVAAGTTPFCLTELSSCSAIIAL